MKVYDFFSSPIGLGHVTRDIAIVNNFEDITTNFVTGSGAAKILKNLDFKVQDAYNPPSFIIQNGTLKSTAKWLWNYYQYYKDCKNISQRILQKDNPDLVISDEDFAALTVAQDMKIPSILVTDVLETRFTKGLASLIEKKMNKSMQKIIKKCNIVILPENGDDQDNIKRVGPIVRQTNFSREELRKKFSFERKTIVISIGGTDAGIFLIEKALESISKINQDIEVVLVSGPAISKKFENVRNLGFVDNLHELIFAADLLISLAGKSTIDEANAYGTPAIFIPIKNHFEQEDNARELGFVFDDINRLDVLILEKLEEDRNQVNTDGAKKASDIIKKLMNEQSNA
ncbi:MAG: UDP-glucuronosyltransferase [Nitrosopumilus sp.]|nr:UDP-glucuronosyltransferase [Nitrosopumilus sp.]MDC4231614.1 UDP-glucuronosyltransferase [Nitrosopumilus sp.]